MQNADTECVLYGSETWTMRNEDIEKLETYEMWTWRRMKRISWMEHIANEEMLAMIGEQRTLTHTHTIGKRQRKRTRHMLRGDSLLRMVIKEKNGGKDNKRKTKTDDDGFDDDKR